MARKRGQNEGSIHQRPNGTWRAQVTLDGKRLGNTADTRKECQEWLKKTIGQIDAGLTFSGAQTIIEEFLEDWLVSMSSQLREGTLSYYRLIVRKHIIPSLGKIKLKDLRPDHIQKFYDTKIQTGLGAGSVRAIHAILHCALTHAHKLGMINRNPASIVSPPKSDTKEMQILDESQISRLLISARGNRIEALYHLAITTGLRQSELLGLKWCDIDWQKKTLQVQRQLKRDFKNRDYFTTPKTRTGKRTIVLGSKTIDILRTHMERQNQERIHAGERWEENDLIFTMRLGKPIIQDNLLYRFRIILKKAGLPRIRFHDLRHTAASLMLNHGIPVIVVSRRLGHSRASITLDVYGHLIPEMQNEAAQLMDELVTPIEIELNPVGSERDQKTEN